MFDSLSDKLQEIIRKTSGSDKLTEENMSDALREIRRALLEADVNLRVVKAFVSSIRERAEGELADNTIISPIVNNNNMVITKV